MRNSLRSTAARPRARLCLSAALALLASTVVVSALLAPTLAAQVPRTYRFEVGAAGAYQRYGSATALDPGFGGLVRLGVWLPANFSVEGEGIFTSPNTTAGLDWSVRTLSGALLYNLRFQERNFFYLKAGYGSSKYDGDACGLGGSIPGVGPCGSTGVLVAGLGMRIGLTPTIMLRGEGLLHRSGDFDISNLGANLGVSFMLGSRTPGDRDGDGIIDRNDRCPATPSGAPVDARGCPRDTDRDGVVDGVDRCPETPAGAEVDTSGCLRDADRDGVTDGSDRCPETPDGATVDARGCPGDTDGDSVLDGLDRCADTPQGAVVDALGCPGDEDSDGVLDGIDRCPRTAPGSAVNSAGCAPNQRREETPEAAPPPQRDTAPAADSAGGEGGAAASQPGDPDNVLRGVQFATGSARLSAASLPVLDSLARALRAAPSRLVEIGGHTDNSGAPSTNLLLSRQRAEAVRDYLLRRGVPAQQMTARGYGATVPLTTDTSAAGRARNRRVEVRTIGS